MKNKNFFLAIFLLFCAAFPQIVEEMPVSEAVSSDSSSSEVLLEPVESSCSQAEVILSSSSEVAISDADSWTEVSSGVSSSSVAGGLLDALYPVAKDEAIAQGRIYGGATLSLIQANTDDDVLNIMIGDVYDAYGYTFTVTAFGGYFIRDAMAIGVRTGYSRTWFDIDFALLEDLLDLKERRKYVSNGFFVQPLLKNYLKVLNSRNVYFFNETSISVEYSYGISQTDNGEDMKKSRSRSWSIAAGINPGICIMVLNRFAFETSVGLLGLNSSVIEVEENNETKSQLVYNVVNFTINLLALDFSLVYFF